jgi:hypothetical protein
VATAPPTPFIAYAPAPMMGESPTLLKKKNNRTLLARTQISCL